MVSLTVSDGTDSDSTTSQVSPSQTQTQAQLSFVDAASTAGNRVHHSVPIPATVKAGDTLMLFMTTNTLSTTINDQLNGWSLVESVEGKSTRGRVWTRTATTSDGTNATVDTSGFDAKSVVAVAAYRSASGAAAVTASASDAAPSATPRATPRRRCRLQRRGPGY